MKSQKSNYKTTQEIQLIDKGYALNFFEVISFLFLFTTIVATLIYGIKVILNYFSGSLYL